MPLFNYEYLCTAYGQARQHENISAKISMALKPRIFSSANVSPSTVVKCLSRKLYFTVDVVTGIILNDL